MFKNVKMSISGANYKRLDEYTLEELYEFLKGNEKEELSILAGVCSEVLRRQLKEQLEKCSK